MIWIPRMMMTTNRRLLSASTNALRACIAQLHTTRHDATPSLHTRLCLADSLAPKACCAEDPTSTTTTLVSVSLCPHRTYLFAYLLSYTTYLT